MALMDQSGSTRAFGDLDAVESRGWLFFWTAFASCLLVALPPVCADDAQRDQDALQGTWKVVELELDGKPANQKLRDAVTFVFADNKMTLAGPKGIGKRHYSFKLDPTKNPKAIDLTALDGPGKGLTGPAIYELKGDELRLCMRNSETKVRPRDFKSWQGSDRGVFKLKRSKPAP
jgi:uncharacterized protein (TIGR03067 family)